MGEQTVSTSGTPSASVPKAGPCAMVIFGGGGDLTKRLVTPALYNLATTRLLPDDFVILGVDHSDGSDESWRASLTEMMQSWSVSGRHMRRERWKPRRSRPSV